MHNLKRLRCLCGLFAVLSGGLVFAEIDLKDFDDDLMRDMDTAIKDLEPVLGAKNAMAASGDAELLRDGFKQTHGNPSTPERRAREETEIRENAQRKESPCSLPRW